MTLLAWLSDNGRDALANAGELLKQKQAEYLPVQHKPTPLQTTTVSPVHPSQIATHHACTFPLTRVASHGHSAEGHEGMHSKQDWGGPQQLWHSSIVVAMRHITWPGAFPRLQ
ncbi:hypothetical protein TRVL_10076 [Trypanosoma vivax]|nr:hypothetical protein TRVL_10076 [Trypanosoma vivax]